MPSNKKTVAVRFTDETHHDVEAFAEKLGISLSAAVNFLTVFAIEQIKSGEKTVVNRTIFSYDPRKNVDIKE